MLSSAFRRALAAAVFAVICLAQPAPPPGNPAPVTLDGVTLFSIRTGLGPFSAEDRAASAGSRLTTLAEDLTIPISAIVAAPSDSSTDLVARDRVLLTVTDADAAAAGLSRNVLATQYLSSIRAAIARARDAYSYRSLAVGAVYTVLATALLLLLLWTTRRFFPVLSAHVEARRGTAIRSIRLQQAELVSADRIAAILLRGLAAVRTLLVLVILYIYVPLVMSFFPWTREYAPLLFGYIAAPFRSAASAFFGYLPNLAVLLAAAAIAYAFIRLARFLFDHLASGAIAWTGFYAEWAEPSYKMVRFLIVAFTATVIFPYLPGSDSPAFRGMSIFLGVLVSLGSTSAIANIVAGTILTFTRAFQVGDRVRIAETVGDVVEKTLLATRIQTIKNELVTVPNAMVLGSHTTDFSARPPATPSSSTPRSPSGTTRPGARSTSC